MRLHPTTLLLFFAALASAATAAHAQQPSPWQGEWGPPDASASRLTLSDCTAATCKFFLEHDAGSIQRCDTNEHTPLTLTSSTDATAHLPGEDATRSCTLHLHRDESAAHPTLAITQSGNGCNYYCIGSATFNTTLTQRSATVYSGAHSSECLHNAGHARMATCTDPALAALEQKWEDLYFDFPLAPDSNPDESGYSHAQAVDASIITHCNADPNPTQCLRDRFTADIATMTAKQQAFIAGYTERGDPATGAALATKIAGRYRHRFANGDVQGEHFTSTDTLTLGPVGQASIHFDAELNFYNGHTCSLSGGALYRKDGTFVFDDDPANALPPEPACKLAIIPSATGVSFRDLTGGCKNYCGERGGWNGAGFTFNERVPTHSAQKPATK
jgi:hypothetical protein